MKIDIKGKELIYKEEGVRVNAYLDQVGIPTIGVGFTFYPSTGNKVKMGDKITMTQCDEIFDNIILLYENSVNNSIKIILTQNQFNALVSLAFNIGCSAFATSTLVNKLNTKSPLIEIEKWFLIWKMAGGDPILLARRKREFKIFNS